MRKLFLISFVAGVTALSHAQLYSTGFEAPSYASGASVATMDGWENGTGAGVSQTVSTDRAASGSQSLKFDNSGGDTSYYSVRHAVPTYSGALDLAVSLYISSSTGADRTFEFVATNSPTGVLGTTTLGVSVGGDGKIRAGTSWSSLYSSAFAYQAAAGTFAGRWLTLGLHVDTATGASSATVSGLGGSTPSYTVGGLTVATAALNVNVGSDYIGFTARNGTGYYDNLSIQAVPEPATLAALGLGCVAVLRCRRR